MGIGGLGAGRILKIRHIGRNAPGEAILAFVDCPPLEFFPEPVSSKNLAFVFCMCFPNLVVSEPCIGAAKLDPVCSLGEVATIGHPFPGYGVTNARGQSDVLDSDPEGDTLFNVSGSGNLTPEGAYPSIVV
jgi:hypothetical protein